MNFLWCGVNYIGNGLFFVCNIILFVCLLLFLYVVLMNISKRLSTIIKDKAVNYALPGLTILFCVFLSVMGLAIINSFSSSFELIDNNSWCDGCADESYSNYRLVHLVKYIFMSIFMYFNIIYLYLKKYINNKLKINSKNKIVIIIGTIIYILVMIVIYLVINRIAPSFDIYDVSC